MKYFPYILILILVSVIGYMIYIDITTDDIDITPYKDKIDSLSTLINEDKQSIQKLIKEAKKNDLKEIQYLKSADSLALIISGLNIEDDCIEIVETQSHEIIALRDGLKQCNKAKTVYIKSYGICQDIVLKYEIKEITTKELDNALLRNYNKKKKKLLIFGLSGWLAFVLTAAILVL